MATKRDVKKDILFFIEEVLIDCMIFMELHPQQEHPEIEEIIDEMEILYSDLIFQVNHIDEEGKKNLKKYFDAIYMQLLDHVHHAFEKLAAVVEKSK
ncbi:MAG: hypothetical protein LBH92_08595 [Bacteroidales bacterium]|jgi:hypothetical protein|nr:hypothetical protein [Bacteroidales bacterium]